MTELTIEVVRRDCPDCGNSDTSLRRISGYPSAVEEEHRCNHCGQEWSVRFIDPPKRFQDE